MSSFELEFSEYPPSRGSFEFARIPWDSRLFELPFFELRLREPVDESLGGDLRDWLASELTDRPAMVHARIPSTALSTGKVLTQAGFYPVETTLDIQLALATMKEAIPTNEKWACLRAATDEDLPAIASIAETAFSADRFTLDPHLPREKAGRRYSSWVRDGYDGGEPVFVYVRPGTDEILGFYHIRERDAETIDLSLAAVSKRLHGSGIGVMMYQDMVNLCKAKGYKTCITRISATNRDVMNLYIRLGFTVSRVSTSFHCYLE